MATITNSQKNGLSSAEGPNTTLPTLHVYPTVDPVLDPGLANYSSPSPEVSVPSGGLTSLRFPADTPPFYFRIQISRYQRSSWRDVGDLSPEATLILPLPMSIADEQQVLWEEEPLGYLGNVVMQTGIPSGDNIGSWAGQMYQNAKDTAGTVGHGLSYIGLSTAEEVGGPWGREAVSGYLAKNGISLNAFMTMMMKGPKYKTHRFKWRFAPKTKDESETLAAMYPLIMNASAPGLAGSGSLFFQWPKVFQLSYHNEAADMGHFLHKFKKSVVTDVRWDFSPESIPSFFSKSKGPESVELELELTSLEFWLQGEY